MEIIVFWLLWLLCVVWSCASYVLFTFCCIFSRYRILCWLWHRLECLVL